MQQRVVRIAKRLASVETDAGFRKEANRVYNAVKKAVNGGSASFKYYKKKYPWFDLGKIAGRRYADTALLFAHMTEKNGAVGLADGNEFDGKRFWIAVHLDNRDLFRADYVPDKKLFTLALVKEAVKFSKSVFVHEMIHLIDNKRLKEDSERHKGDPATSEDYYNSPEEFNAFYQEAVDTFLEDFREGENTELLTYPFQVFVKKFKKDYLSEFSMFVNEKYDRKLKKRLYGLYNRLKERERTASDKWSRLYPKITGSVDGLRVVSKNVSNVSSIAATLDNYEVLPGLRKVKIRQTGNAASVYASSTDVKRSRELAEEIRQSKSISPLIAVHDKEAEREGPYVLEGLHRYAALLELGKKYYPALVVVDLDEVEM